jgi:hypothetical protein
MLLSLAAVTMFEAVFQAPVWVRTTSFALSALLGCVATTTSLKTVMDRVLAAAVGVVVVLIALGFALHLTPWGLTQKSWSAGWALVLLSAGFLVGNRPTLQLPRRPDSSLVGWSIASLLIVVAAFGAARSKSGSELATPLSLSVVSSGVDQVKLSVVGPVDRRDLSLVRLDGDNRQTMVSVDLSSKKPFEMVMAKPAVRVSIALVDGSGAVQRTVIIDPALAIAPKQ